jgi:hypothetical protein
LALVLLLLNCGTLWQWTKLTPICGWRPKQQQGSAAAAAAAAAAAVAAGARGVAPPLLLLPPLQLLLLLLLLPALGLTAASVAGSETMIPHPTRTAAASGWCLRLSCCMHMVLLRT